jgi:hypothetical protein
MTTENPKKFRKNKEMVNEYRHIGGYRIHLSSLLRNNWLRVFHKSDKLLPKSVFPRPIVSDNFKYLLLNLLEDNKFTEEDYAALDEKEKELFDDLIKFTKMDITSNRILRTHKHYNDANNKKVIDRFNLLKGQVIAGNNNPEIMKELKKHILYMKMNELANQKELEEILYFLLYL